MCVVCVLYDYMDICMYVFFALCVLCVLCCALVCVVCFVCVCCVMYAVMFMKSLLFARFSIHAPTRAHYVYAHAIIKKHLFIYL